LSEKSSLNVYFLVIVVVVIIIVIHESWKFQFKRQRASHWHNLPLISNMNIMKKENKLFIAGREQHKQLLVANAP
jgi:hypothetical protein